MLKCLAASERPACSPAWPHLGSRMVRTVQMMVISARCSKLRLLLAQHSSGSRSVLPHRCLPRAAPASCLSTPGCLVQCLILISLNQELGLSNYIITSYSSRGKRGSRLIGLTIEPNPFRFYPVFLIFLSFCTGSAKLSASLIKKVTSPRGLLCSPLPPSKGRGGKAAEIGQFGLKQPPASRTKPAGSDGGQAASSCCCSGLRGNSALP